MTIAVAFAWTAYDRFPAIIETARLIAVLALILLLVAGLCAIQLIPTAEYLAQSDRAAFLPRDEVMHWSMQKAALLQLLFPHSSNLLPAAEANSLGPGFEHALALIQSPYLGIPSLCLAVVGLIYGRERRFWGTAVFVAVILALGDGTPVLPSLYEWLPHLIGKFRYPEKFLFVVHLGAALLAAEGTERIVQKDAAAERMAWIVIVVLALAVVPLYFLRCFWPFEYLRVLGILSGKNLPPSQFVSLGIDVFAKAKRLELLLAVLGGLLLLRRSVLSAPTFRVLLGMLVVADLTSANRHLNLAVSWDELLGRRLLIDAEALENGQQRIFHFELAAPAGNPPNPPTPRLTRWSHSIDASQDLAKVYGALWESLYADAGMIYGVPSISGGDGIARSSDTRLLATLARLPLDRAVLLLRAYGAAFLIGPDSLQTSGLEPLAADHATPYYTYRVRDPLPFAHTVSKLTVAPVADAMNQISEPPFSPREQAVVESLPKGWRNVDAVSNASLEILRHTDEFLRIGIRSEAPTFVVVNQSYFPGWRAQIDDVVAEIYRTNSIVQGVAVGPGAHTIELRYRPTSYVIGAYVSLASLLVLLGLIVRAPKSGPVHAP